LWLGLTEQMTKMTLWAIPDKTTREFKVDGFGQYSVVRSVCPKVTP
jgi:hypothetical protein